MAAFAAKRLVRTRSQLSVFVIHVHFFQFWRKCINLSMQQFLKDYEATPLDKKPILVIGMQVVILYIARIAKAASHKLLGKLSLDVSFVLSLPSAQCSSQSACHLPLPPGPDPLEEKNAPRRRRVAVK